MNQPLVLSLFPGIGLLDMAFEEQGFCVVRGPDLLWGGTCKKFHPPAGKFDGVIGGPPCQAFSPLANVNRALGRKPASDLIPQFERCVLEAAPMWFVMENVHRAPLPMIGGYAMKSVLLNNRWCGAEQNRVRRFTLGQYGHLSPLFFIEEQTFEPIDWKAAVTGSVGGRRRTANPTGKGKQKRTWVDEPSAIAKGRTLAENCELQGLPRDFDLPGFTDREKRRAIGNGVPLPMGRAVAKAVWRAMYGETNAASA